MINRARARARFAIIINCKVFLPAHQLGAGYILEGESVTRIYTRASLRGKYIEPKDDSSYT